MTIRARASTTIAGGRLVGVDRRGDPDTDSVLLRDGVIASITPSPETGRTIDASGLLIAPGFVDLQCNGAHGIDLSSQPERLWELAAFLPRFGVTAFLPTLVSCPQEIVERALEALRRRPRDFRGAEPLGLHIEGPMLNPSRRGAHDERLLRLPDERLVQGWRRESGVAMATLAPELPGAGDVIRRLRRGGVVVAAGHTDATADEMTAGIDAGLTCVTHIFNAMRPFGHHDVGPAGVALTDRRVTVGLIADGVHVDPRAVAIVWSVLGADRLALVTDSVSALGADGAVTSLGDTTIVGDGDAVRDADGALAGSCLSMDQAVRNLVQFTSCSIDEAIVSATATPARVIGAGGGRARAGAPADVVLLTPTGDVVATFVAGECVYGDPPWRS